MKKEDKELLIKDLCARLPYDCMVECSISEEAKMDAVLLPDHITELKEGKITIKPYLRPMSSMTDKELDTLWSIWEDDTASEAASKMTDFLNKRHLDHHHLIDKGLALEAVKGMYKKRNGR